VNIVECVTLFFYVSLGLELTVWHTPSVASSVNILASEETLKKAYSERFQKIFERATWFKILVFFTPLIFIYIAHFYPLYRVFFLPDVDTSTPVIAFVGVLLIMIGRVVSLIYIFTIRRQNKQKGDSFRLQTNGVFSLSRNPGLIGLYLSFLGFFLLFPYWFFGFCLVVYPLHMHYKILMEEDFLSNKFGKPYEHYLKKSKRYL